MLLCRAFLLRICFFDKPKISYALKQSDSVTHQIFVNLMRTGTTFGNRPDDK